jgi:hypothetical protein
MNVMLRFFRSSKRLIAASALALSSLLFTAAPAQAQNSARQSADTREIFRAFDQQEYSRAIRLIEGYLKRNPGDAQMLYNLACAHCLLGDHDASAAALLRAFRAGFRDIDHLRSDPDLAALRDHPTYKTILEEADKAAKTASKSAVDRWREKYGDKDYRYEYDSDHRINFATALDEISHREMREMLERQADQMINSLFEDPPTYDILIAIPTPRDSNEFFGGNQSIGGMYQHSSRRLVSRDIGGSLRHEFVHAMHFAHMERLRQQHPLWIQEGIAALYEDYELDKDGQIKFLPNDRQIIVKARAKAGRLTKWKDLMAMSADSFMDKAQQMYPQARSIFEYLAHEKKLETWYREYVRTFREDRTGAKAFEIACGKPIAEIERDWRRWVAAQPEIDLLIRADDAALGIRSRENGSNDGVVIQEVIAGSAAAEGGLQKGDIIVAIDDQSTRSLMDLRKIIAVKDVGDIVEVRGRRDGEYFKKKITLRPAYGTS